MFCPNCGNQIQDGTAFCAYCGTSVGTPTASFAQPNGYSQYAPQQPYGQPTVKNTQTVQALKARSGFEVLEIVLFIIQFVLIFCDTVQSTLIAKGIYEQKSYTIAEMMDSDLLTVFSAILSMLAILVCVFSLLKRVLATSAYSKPLHPAVVALPSAVASIFNLVAIIVAENQHPEDSASFGSYLDSIIIKPIYSLEIAGGILLIASALSLLAAIIIVTPITNGNRNPKSKTNPPYCGNANDPASYDPSAFYDRSGYFGQPDYCGQPQQQPYNQPNQYR